MKEYSKWLAIGVLIGVGISVGWKATDYLIDAVILKKDSDKTIVVNDPSDLIIKKSRLVKTPMGYQVVAVIENNSGKILNAILVKAQLSDGSGIIDQCEVTETNIELGETNIVLFCRVSQRDYPEVKVSFIKVEKSIIY